MFQVLPHYHAKASVQKKVQMKELPLFSCEQCKNCFGFLLFEYWFGHTLF